MDTKFIIYILCFFFLMGTQKPERTMQEHIADEIIRLHVIANSDTDEDQALKLKVKDEIVSMLCDKFAAAQNIEDAREIIRNNLSSIEETAARVMVSEGYFYSVHASLSSCDFPIKQYGDMTFPAGEYEALRVELGTGVGKNWWCVMFPSLCYVDETYDVITNENKEEFREILTEEEYESLLSQDKPNVFYKSKLKQLFDKLIDYLPIKE